MCEKYSVCLSSQKPKIERLKKLRFSNEENSSGGVTVSLEKGDNKFEKDAESCYHEICNFDEKIEPSSQNMEI